MVRLIQMNKEAVIVEYGRGKWTTNFNRITTNPITWVEEVHKILQERNLEIINLTREISFLIENKIITEFAEQ